MSIEPDNLLVQSIALSYFAAGLWLITSTNILSIDATVRHWIRLIVAVVAIAATIFWAYFFFVVLQAQSLHGVMLTQGLLILVTIPALVSQSFSVLRQRVAQAALALLLIGLPLLYLWLLKSFGLSLFGWIPVLIQTKGTVFVPILALTLYLIAHSPAHWRSIAILTLLFIGGLITMLGALISLAFPAA